MEGMVTRTEGECTSLFCNQCFQEPAKIKRKSTCRNSPQQRHHCTATPCHIVRNCLRTRTHCHLTTATTILHTINYETSIIYLFLAIHIYINISQQLQNNCSIPSTMHPNIYRFSLTGLPENESCSKHGDYHFSNFS